MLEVLSNQLPSWFTDKNVKFLKAVRQGHWVPLSLYDGTPAIAKPEDSPDAIQVVETTAEDAVLISSNSDEPEQHWVMLDLDFDCKLIESSTPGQYHLFIDKKLPTKDMNKLVDTLTEVGLMNEGVRKLQWRKYGYLSLRLPWVKKKDDFSWNMQTEHANGSDILLDW